ncbi:MAG: UDP-glucose 4-epimerase GalE [Rhodocyclales bacterium RIFCSPLOWO2_02_FULL_63_24]|nr:MAG: UDP-glucose 4-epimerase GalE [Rhodocyclales bacterium RIFCSPLOWO2_02_FULL_63_24]
MILLTGGAGYIGLHTAAVLIEAGQQVVLFDNFSNSKPLAVQRLESIVGRAVPCVNGDVRSRQDMDGVFDQHPIAAVVHFAGLKSVSESGAQPLHYYDNNVVGTLVLLEAMRRAEVKRIVFSSSACVYGEPDSSPIPETAALRPANTYGRTKLMVEEILRDLQVAAPNWSVALLRYFNPVGAHPSGLIGEDPNGIPNNLMPFVTQVAVGRLPELQVFGGDYPTPDGSGVRDYIHVMDLADGHRAALDWALGDPCQVLTANLGTGQGYSVLDLLRSFEKACGRAIPHRIVARRPGDVPAYWGDPALAARQLGWAARRTLDDMCRDSWNWQSRNPQGFA